MKQYFYFKSLNNIQEKEVRRILSFATAKIADGVINNSYPFFMTDSALSVFDSKSEEIFFNYDRTADSVTYIGCIKQPNYKIKIADAKKVIELLTADGKVAYMYNVDQTNKDELTKVYLDLIDKSKKEPDKEFSLRINGNIPYEFEKKTLYNIYPKFKDEIDNIVLEASKESYLKQGRLNEYGVKTKTVNSAISELSQKLKANGLYTTEEFNTLVDNLKKNKITKEDFDSNCNALIQEFKSRNEEFEDILKELKDSEPYKNCKNKDELNLLLDKLNLRKKYVYEKADKDTILTEYYSTIANFTIDQGKSSDKIDKEQLEKDKNRLIYYYLLDRKIITGKDTDNKPVYNTEDFSQEFIDAVKTIISRESSFEKIRARIDQLLKEKKDKEDNDIKQMNEWINSNFKYTKIPEQLLKVKAEVEKHKMTYQEFLDAYYRWAKEKYWNQGEKESKTYALYFALYKDLDCKDLLKTSAYTHEVKQFGEKPKNLRGNCFKVTGSSEDALVGAFNRKITNVENALRAANKDYSIEGIKYYLYNAATQNNQAGKFADENFNSLKEQTVKDIKIKLNAIIREDENDEEERPIEFVEEDSDTESEDSE